MGRRGDGETRSIAPSPHSPVSPSAVWRVFCAVELPDPVREQLSEHIRDVRQAVPDAVASWTRVENIHLTLKFFGNVAVDRIPTISEAIAKATKEFSLFQIEVGGTGVFPKSSRAQVLWIGVNDPSGKLVGLQRQVENECAKKAFEKEDRAYRPHLTIARIRRPEGARQLADAHLQIKFEPAQMAIQEIILFRSELNSKGSRYTPISRHELPR